VRKDKREKGDLGERKTPREGPGTWLWGVREKRREQTSTFEVDSDEGKNERA